MDLFSYRDRVLHCEDLPIPALAKLYGTPLYVYSKRSLLDHCRHIEKAFDGRNHVTYYAIKANANRALLKLIAGEGLGADVGSGGELHLALQSGFKSAKITYSGVGKRDDEIAFGLRRAINAFNVDVVVLDIAMPEIGLQRPRIMPSVRQSKTASMSQHMRVRLEWQLGHPSCAFEHPGEAGIGERRATLRREHERRPGVLLALEPPQGT